MPHQTSVAAAPGTVHAWRTCSPCLPNAALRAGRPRACRLRRGLAAAAANTEAASPAPGDHPATAPAEDTSTSDAPVQHLSASPAKPTKMSPHAAVSEALASVSITIVGADGALNAAVGAALAKKIGWFPVTVSKVLTGLHKADSVAAMERDLGREALVSAEAEMLRGMREQFRCCVATLGGGAATQPAVWNNLWGSFTVWIDEVDRRAAPPDSPERAAYAQAEVHARLEVPTGFGAKKLTLEAKAAKVVPQVITGLGRLLQAQPHLPEAKRLYVQMGCRGDWPDLQPPEWDPVLSDVFGRQRTVPLAAAAEPDQEARIAAGTAAYAATAAADEAAAAAGGARDREGEAGGA